MDEAPKPDQPHRAPRPLRWPYRWYMGVRLALSAVLLIALMALLVLFGLVHPMGERTAERVFASTARETEARLHAAFGSAATALQVAAGQWQVQAPALDDPMPFIIQARRIIAALPIVTSIVAGNGRGEGWLVLRREKERDWWVRLTDRARWGDVQHFMILDDEGRIQRAWQEPRPYDPRERPWYQRAVQTPGEMRWTNPYVFYTTREPGITAAMGWRDDQGTPWAVGFDLRAIEITRLVQTLPLSQEGLIWVTDSSDEVLGLSFAELPLQQDAKGDWRLPRIAEIDHPVFHALPTITETSPALLAFSPLDRSQAWLLTKRSVHLGGQTLGLWMAAPWSLFVPGWVQWVQWLIAGALISAALAAWLTWRSARRMAQPLEYLAQSVRDVGRLEFARPVRTDWRILELHELAVAMNDTRRRLRVAQRRLRRREEQLAREVQALAAAEQRLLHVGLHDPLTDLPNRRLLMERLQHALARSSRDGSPVAVLFVDLDRFKEVNDRWGHDAGDALLQEVAQRLSALVRAGDTVARLGGDEFVLVLEECPEPVALERAQAVLAALEQALLQQKGHPVQVAASVGIALAPRDGLDAMTLLRHADAAMYRAKLLGRGRVVVYEAGFSETQEEARALRDALKVAIEQRQIELWWQPQFDLRSGRVVSAEGLLRWRHPDGHWVPPSTFIPLAEDAGLIDRLGLLVVDLALEHGPQLDAAGWSLRRLAINVSALQLRNPHFAQEVLQRLRDRGWPPTRLELEITESVLLESEESCAQLRTLADAGVRLALDDFGTGYSSLSYLRRLPLDILKIDASFVRDIGKSPSADALVESLIQLGRAVNLELIAEGIETPEQRDFLAQRGVDLGQGYLWSPAQPLGEWIVRRTEAVAAVS